MSKALVRTCEREIVCLRVTPPPPAPPGTAAHGGLKLDWRSEVGCTGMLVEWRPVGRDQDAGVPGAVVRMLAAGLCAACTVAGCTLANLPPASGGWTAVVGGHALRLPGRRWLRSRPLGLLASREPLHVARMFEDEDFVWALESQALFLAAPGTLPRLDRALVTACFDIPIRAGASELAAAGVVGLLRSGVDGDVAGLYLPDAAWRVPILGALADAGAAVTDHVAPKRRQ